MEFKEQKFIKALNLLKMQKSPMSKNINADELLNQHLNRVISKEDFVEHLNNANDNEQGADF